MLPDAYKTITGTLNLRRPVCQGDFLSSAIWQAIAFRMLVDLEIAQPGIDLGDCQDGEEFVAAALLVVWRFAEDKENGPNEPFESTLHERPLLFLTRRSMMKQPGIYHARDINLLISPPASAERSGTNQITKVTGDAYLNISTTASPIATTCAFASGAPIRRNPSGPWEEYTRALTACQEF